LSRILRLKERGRIDRQVAEWLRPERHEMLIKAKE